MYGMVNKAIEQLVCSRFGQEKWEEIRQKAGIEEDVFIGNESYDDAVTYRLVAAATEVLALPAEKILHAFGEFWVLHTAREEYGELLEAGGRTLKEFLENLSTFHDRVVLIFPKLQPPRFRVTESGDHSLTLHYFTHRPGLSEFVVGLIHGLGKMFQTDVKVHQTADRNQGADHDEFSVTWK